MLATEVDNVLRRTFELEHFVVTSGFQATGFELVSNLDLLVVLAFIIKAVLKFNNELNGLTVGS